MAWILFGTFIALILLRVPISIAIGSATVLTFLTSDFSSALQIIPQQMLEGVNKASLTAVPFYRALGFSKVGPITVELPRGIGFPAMLMRRIL